jgi:hypothetical protein
MIPGQQLKAICEHYAPRPRTARKLASEALVNSLIFHQLQPASTLAAHGAHLHGIRMSDSAFSQRCQLLQVALQPLRVAAAD